MSEFFITSDEHYGHASIIQFCNRPFTSTEEMQETLIERHNKKVPNKKSYLTLHAGDMFWRTVPGKLASDILARLNGRHAFLYGNHDELIEANEDFFRSRFEWIRGRNKENTSHSVHFNKKLLVISHFAQRVWQNSHKGSWHVYGHSHGEIPDVGKSFDIGVDCHDFTPWSLEEIEAKMNTLAAHHVIPANKVWRPDPELVVDASVAQAVEQGTCNAQVGGSNPSAGSKFDLATYFENIARREDA